MAEQFDFIAIGDVVTDAFIRLKEAEVHADIRHHENQICMRFGDKIPYESVTVIPAVGNSPNAAVSAARLGLRTALITNLGDDLEGANTIEALKDNHVDTRLVTKHHGIKTNYHYVLWFQDDRTILIKHEDYPYALPNFGTPHWLYLSSLGEQSLEYHRALEKYLEARPGIKLAFQPGTFQIKFGPEQLMGIYRRTEAFFCNVEEAQRILNTAETNIVKLMHQINQLGPKIVAITDGIKGAYAYHEWQAWFIPPYPDPQPPLNRTGAGDAFSSTLTVAFALGKSVPEALAWGPINSMSVVQKVGARAGLLARPELEKYLANAPESYRVQKIA